MMFQTASFWLLKHLKPELHEYLLITLCPTFTNKRQRAKLIALLSNFRRRYELFFFVLRHKFKQPKKLISDEEIEMLEKFGKVKVFPVRAEAAMRAGAFRKFITVNL